MTETNTCELCGACCKLFYINLSEEEYNSGKFDTIFDDLGQKLNYGTALECGANFLAKGEDGSCIYLRDKVCSIHATRPGVCREYFCNSNNKDHFDMHRIIAENKQISK